MLTISGTVLTIEGGFACLFIALLTMERKRGKGKEDILWGLVWVTRLIASLYGSRYVAANGAELTVYVALQACSGLSLMLVLARYELKVYKERFFRRLALRLTEGEGKTVVESITVRQTASQQHPENDHAPARQAWLTRPASGEAAVSGVHTPS